MRKGKQWPTMDCNAGDGNENERGTAKKKRLESESPVFESVSHKPQTGGKNPSCDRGILTTAGKGGGNCGGVMPARDSREKGLRVLIGLWLYEERRGIKLMGQSAE